MVRIREAFDNGFPRLYRYPDLRIRHGLPLQQHHDNCRDPRPSTNKIQSQL